MSPVVIAVLVGLVILVLTAAAGGKRESAPAHSKRTAPPQLPPTRPPAPTSGGNGHTRSQNGVPTSPKAQPKANGGGGHLLDARKTLAAFDFILRSLGRQSAWSSPEQRENYAHDLAVMLDQADLTSASLELLAADRTVLYRHRVQFQQAAGPRGVDAARGIELPLLPAGRIVEHRLIVSPVSRLAVYRGQLRLSWGAADRLQDRAGSQFADAHIGRINGGKVTGQVFVSDEARRTATVVTVSPAGDYAFARDAAFPADVYLHKAQCDMPLSFAPGMRVSFIPIQTRRGIQGRSIHSAG